MKLPELTWTKAETSRGTYWRAGRWTNIAASEKGIKLNMNMTSRFEPRHAASESDGVAIVSGGMDSVTLVYYLRAVHRATPHLLSFDYGQRHSKELQYALNTAEELGLRWSLIDLTGLTDLISNSALTSKQVTGDPVWRSAYSANTPMVPEIEVPEGHYAEDNMRVTVVPNRNMIMLSIACGVAVNAGYKYVATGVHAGDHYQYPDCRPEFLDAAETTMVRANQGFIYPDFELLAPFSEISKNVIAEYAYQFGVPLDRTWSCYKGEDVHCGRCGTCVERLEAIHSVEEAPADWDQTQYADKNFWREAVASAKS